jgi:diadenosine hexaphosphate hydrolase (ATP-forming)
VSRSTQSDGGRPTHAGGVVYRWKKKAPELLLVTVKLDSSVWVLPKGHVEPGESTEETAVREVFEEAGVKARVVEFLTTARQVVRGKPQRIEFFLMERVTEEPAGEGRRLAWLSQDEAVERVTFAETRDVLILACERLAESSSSR